MESLENKISRKLTKIRKKCFFQRVFEKYLRNGIENRYFSKNMEKNLIKYQEN